MSVKYETGAIIWVRLSQKWWPGRVSSLEECPVQFVENLKKDPLAVVKFFNESEFHDVSKPEHIFSYSCSRKNDIIRKGLNAVKYDPTLAEKFEADVAMAEKLTGGNMNIVKELKEMIKPKIDYSDLGFGTPKQRKQAKDQCMQRKGFSNIGEAIQYKRGASPISPRVIEHKVKIMEQPKQKSEDEIKSSTNWYKCYVCGFTCSRLNVIIWHNKVHLKKVEDYDSGIRLPGRRKRRRKTQRNKLKIPKSENIDHAQTNGFNTPKLDSSQEASQILKDWEDDDEEDDQKMAVDKLTDEDTTVNGIANDEESSDASDNDNSDDNDYDDNEYPQHRGQRQPMPKQVDINTAFDALLADSSPLHRNNQNLSYVNNDSDSECSDWEKYYAKESEGEGNNNGGETNHQNGHLSQSVKTSGGKRLKRLSSSESSNGHTSSFHDTSCKTEGRKSSRHTDISSSNEYGKRGKSGKIRSRSRSPPSRKSSKAAAAAAAAASPASPGPSISKSSSPLPERTREEQSEEHSTHSSSSSTSSGPAYMLVAVDAHGNNVPMPVLSEGGNHLVAVEASMEDGSTRTLYIDPAHLGPNVDLNNLMLHIDNSGQETVIIPTSTSDGEIISSTLVEHSVQDNPEEDQEEDPPEQGSPRYSKTRLDNDALREQIDTFLRTSKEGATDVKTEEKVEGSKDSRGKEKEDNKAVEMEKEKSNMENSQLVEDVDEDSEDDELPDLSAPAWNAKYLPNDIVWVSTHGLWWPSFVLKIYTNQNKASILFINCQQKTPLKVPLDRLSIFSSLDYNDIFKSQKDKAAGLAEAMEMASKYQEFKSEDDLQELPRKFFSRPLADQKSIIDKLVLSKRKLDAVAKAPSSNLAQPLESASEVNEDEEVTEEKGRQTPIDRKQYSEISDDRLSERDLLKLVSATKARRTANEKFVRFIKSEPCLEHLRKICSGKVQSDRHEYFMENYLNMDYLDYMMAGVHCTGSDFFGEEFEQGEDVLMYLWEKFEKGKIGDSLEFPRRKFYINIVLFPEAIKESLRVVSKTPEEELENVLKNGPYQTRTELKAKRLEYL